MYTPLVIISDIFPQEVLDQIQQYSEEEITSEAIGLVVLSHLKAVDEVAYVRFASVYQSFDNIDSFKNVVDDLQRVTVGESEYE